MIITAMPMLIITVLSPTTIPIITAEPLQSSVSTIPGGRKDESDALPASWGS